MTGIASWFGDNWADAVALLLSAAAVSWAGASWREARGSRRAAERSAAAAEISATHAQRSADAADTVAGIDTQRFELEHPAIAFELLKSRGQFLLHNIGREPARHLRVLRSDGQELATVDRLPPGEVSEPFRVKSTWQTGVLTYLTVDGDDMPSVRVAITDPIPGPQKPNRLRLR